MIANIVQLKRYRLPYRLTGDITITDCVPYRHVLDKVVFFNDTANEITITLNINGESTVKYNLIAAQGYIIISPRDKYFSSNHVYIGVSSANWNNASLEMQIFFWER
jgi:hypothetical protein